MPDLIMWFTEAPLEQRGLKYLTWNQIKDSIMDMALKNKPSIGSAVCKGNIQLTGCTVVTMQEDSIMLLTSTGKSYMLTAPPEVMKRWSNALQNCIQTANVERDKKRKESVTDLSATKVRSYYSRNLI